MISFLFGADFWSSPTPLLLTGLLATLAVLVWDWRVSLPATLFVQLLMGQVAVQRGLIPGEWGRVFAWVVVGCLLILFLSAQQSDPMPVPGRLGTIAFRVLLFCLGGFLLTTVDVTDLLPLLDPQMTRTVLWLALCALFGISTGEGALQSGLALLLWLIGAEIALLAVTPAAVVVVVMGAVFLLVALACAYLLLAENLTLAENTLPITDAVFPADTPPQPPLHEKLAVWRLRLTALILRAQQGDNLR
jgi:hypothetical protein